MVSVNVSCRHTFRLGLSSCQAKRASWYHCLVCNFHMKILYENGMQFSHENRRKMNLKKKKNEQISNVNQEKKLKNSGKM